MLILSADVGEGHDSAARALAAELESLDAEVAVRDGLAALGRLLQRVIRDGSRVQFERYPWTFGPVYALLMHVAPVRWAAERVLYWIGARGLLRAIVHERPDVVVSTYPGLTSVLGRLRRRGKLEVPIASAILDLTSFPFWTNRGVDQHFVMHAPSVALVERLVGAGGVCCVRPVVDRAFLEPLERLEARSALYLPERGPVVVVAGGGWGIGDIEGAVPVALGLDEATVVAVAGRNDALRERLELVHAGNPRVRVLGFTDAMSDLLAAADALVHPGGGVTALEALARGCATVIYAPPPGHWRANARAMGRLGIAEVARGRAELSDALERALSGGPGERTEGREVSSAAALVCSLAPRVRRIPRWRLAAGRAFASLALALVLVAGALSSDETYSVAAARFEKLRPKRELPVRAPLVGVVVQAPADDAAALGRRLARAGARVTFADRSLHSASIATLRRLGDEVVPELRPTKLSRWVSTRALLRREARALGLPRRFFYLAPPRGATLGQYALARSAGGSPVVGSRSVQAGAPSGGPPLHRGEIVVVRIDSARDAVGLERLLGALRRRGLSPAPLGRLASEAPTRSTPSGAPGPPPGPRGVATAPGD